MFNGRIPASTVFNYNEGEDDKKIYKIEWNYNTDTVFNMVVRALLIDRIEDDAPFKIRYNEIIRNAEMYDSSYDELHRRLLTFDTEEHDEDLWLIAVKRSDKEWFDKLSEGVKEKSPEWVETAKVRKFFSRTEVTCFTCGKRTIVIYKPIENMSLETERYVLMGTPVYLPWFFKEKPITKEETEFLETLSKTNVEPFLKAIANIAAIKGIREKKMEAALSGIETRFAKNKLEYHKNEISSLEQTIAMKREEISNLLIKIRDKNIIIEGLRNVVKNENNEILDFFKANKNLVFNSCNGDSIEFFATGYLDVFDSDTAEEFVDNYDSIIYDYSNISRDDTEKLFNAIFVEQSVKLKSVAAYRIKISEFRVTGIADASYIPEVQDYFPNTHIDRYQCLGDYEMMMVDALKAGDTIQCLSLCGMSVRSLNFADSTVMEEFTTRITRTNKRAFELNGNSYTLNEVLEELRKEG